MNILITAIGSFSVSTVIQSLKSDNRFNKIYGCDIYPKEWHYISKEFEDVFLAPYVSDENHYLDFIKNIISIYNIILSIYNIIIIRNIIKPCIFICVFKYCKFFS